MQKLLRGRIDAALFSNDISANHFRARLSAATRLIYLPVTPLEVHIVLSKSLGMAIPSWCSTCVRWWSGCRSLRWWSRPRGCGGVERGLRAIIYKSNARFWCIYNP